jgi:hypothetical protein
VLDRSHGGQGRGVRPHRATACRGVFHGSKQCL